MHNNLKVIIKTFSTIYLSREVLFPSVPSEGIPTFLLVAVSIMSLGSTKPKNHPWNGEKKDQPTIAISQWILDL